MQLAQQHSAVSLIGFMTLALILAFLAVGVSARILRSFDAAKDYEAALQKLRGIETQAETMTAAMQEVQRDYEKSLAEEKAAHEREVFALQQTIFERNSEILSLKTTLLDMKKTRTYDNY